MRGRLKSEDTKSYKSSSGDIFMTKTELVVIIIIIICVLSLGFRRQKKKRTRWEKKSHTQTHPRKPILTKNHLLALRLHA